MRMRHDVSGIGSGPLWNDSHSCESSVRNSLAADFECMKKVDVTPEVDCRRALCLRSAHPWPQRSPFDSPFCPQDQSLIRRGCPLARAGCMGEDGRTVDHGTAPDRPVVCLEGRLVARYRLVHCGQTDSTTGTEYSRKALELGRKAT